MTAFSPPDSANSRSDPDVVARAIVSDGVDADVTQAIVGIVDAEPIAFAIVKRETRGVGADPQPPLAIHEHLANAIAAQPNPTMPTRHTAITDTEISRQHDTAIAQFHHRSHRLWFQRVPK